MKRTYKLAKLGSFDYENETTDDRYSVTVTPFGKTISGRTVWADIDDNSKLYTVYDNRLWYYGGQVYGR